MENCYNSCEFLVPRLLIQMDETQRTLDEFWNKHASHLKLCLQLRQFELDFRELQVKHKQGLNFFSPPS